jgi:hypothetical protein
MKSLFTKIVFLTLMMCPASLALATSSYKMDGDTIYRDGNVFAQLRFFKKKDSETWKGIAIYYFDSKEQIWICPKEGWKLVDGKSGAVYTDVIDINNLFYSEPHNFRLYLLLGDKDVSKYAAITAGCVSYSIDGNLIMSLVLPGMFWNSTAEFDIINKKFK